jgi:hypothetical protein
MPVPLLERFERYLPEQLRDDECWEWQGCRTPKGYGRIMSPPPEYRSLQAHRVAWEAHHAQPIPLELQVLHRCDNPACVNPAHLFLGTNEDNRADMVAKNRQCKGQAHSNSRLTEAQVSDIRKRYAVGIANQYQLAEQFGVSQQLISGIVLRKRWRHLP